MIPEMLIEAIKNELKWVSRLLHLNNSATPVKCVDLFWCFLDLIVPDALLLNFKWKVFILQEVSGVSFFEPSFRNFTSRHQCTKMTIIWWFARAKWKKIKHQVPQIMLHWRNFCFQARTKHLGQNNLLIKDFKLLLTTAQSIHYQELHNL